MKIELIIYRLTKLDIPRDIKEFVNSLRFEERYNTLREIIYHIDIYESQGNFSQVDALLKAAEKIAPFVENENSDNKKKEARTLKIITYKKRGKYYKNIGENQRAIAYYNKIIKSLNLPEEENFLAEILMEIGIWEEQSGKKKEAFIKFDQAARIYGKKQDAFNYEASLFNCGHVLYDMNILKKALQFCEAVIEHYKHEKNLLPPVAHSYLEIANIHELENNNEKSKIYYQKALEYYRRLDDKVKMSDILNRIGSFELNEGRLNSADLIFQEAIYLKRYIDYHQGRSRLGEITADHLRLSGNLDLALKFYLESLNSMQKSGAGSRKKTILFKIFKIMKQKNATSKDLGTFIEKFKKDYIKSETKMSNWFESMEEIDYRKLHNDGFSPETIGEWKYRHPKLVNRKFLKFLLRNICRLNHEANDNTKLKQNIKKLNAVEELFQEKKEGS